MPMVTTGFRLDTRDIQRLDELRDQLEAQHPGLRPTRSDALRYAIGSSGTAARLPPGTKPLDPDKPLGS